MREKVREVAISDCVHYCGFRYGRNELNPYENYISGLAQGVPLKEIRSRFIEFLRFYRPRDLGEALGVVTSRPVPLWWLPWKSWRKLFRQPGWCASPNLVPDILTYFCPQGIQWARIAEEFEWLERAWEAISTVGYQPERHCYVTVLELTDASGSSFVVTDGNHRLSALAALGLRTAVVKQGRFSVIRRNMAPIWPLVLSGHVTLGDARRLFDAYRRGNQIAFRSQQPAKILDSQGAEVTDVEMQMLLSASESAVT